MIKYISIIFLFFFSIHLFFSQESTINRIDENGRKQDQWIFYYPDGGIKEIHYYKDDKLDGWFSSFYEKDLDRYDIYNSLKEQIFYKNGLKHGNRIQLSPLGKLVLQCYYENDTLERKYCSYEQGVLMYFCFYEKGKINGELRMLTSYKTFYNRYERKVNCIVYYTHGRIDSSLYFYETDEIKHRSMYENNQIIWEHTYDKIGNIMWAEYYDNDRVYKIEQYQRDFKKEQDIKNDQFFRKYYKDTLSLIWIKHYKEE